MNGYLSLVLHAHLPFVRHPEHEKFLEESWLFEAITETYLPLLQIMAGWQRDGMETRLTLTLSPTLCAMLRDPLLQDRYTRHLHGLVDLAGKEIHRTHWDRAFRELAWMYHHRFTTIRDTYLDCGRDLVGAFRALAPPSAPIRIQRWSARRLGVTVGVLLGGAIAGSLLWGNLSAVGLR